MDEILRTWKELGSNRANGKCSAIFSLDDPCYGIVKEYSIRMLRHGFSRKGWASINGS